MKNTVIWFAITVHTIWAGLLLLSVTPTNVTGINLLYRVLPNRFLLAGVLLTSSVLGYLALRRYGGNKSLALLLPQQSLLVIPAIAVIQAISAGHFSDGVIRPRDFLIADKIGLVVLAIFHTVSLLQFHVIDETSVTSEEI